MQSLVLSVEKNNKYVYLYNHRNLFCSCTNTNMAVLASLLLSNVKLSDSFLYIKSKLGSSGDSAGLLKRQN